MLTSQELSALVRELATTRVLSIYLDARVTDPAMRHAWRPALVNALRAARAALPSDEERALFDRAAAHLDEPPPSLGGTWNAPGWVAFITPEGPRYTAALPVRVATHVGWRDGPVVTPYLRVLKQHRHVAVAIVESRSATLYRYAWGELTPLGELRVSEEPEPGTARGAAAETRGTSLPSARGAVATEAARRKREAEFHRLATSVASRLAEIAGDDGWVLIDGTPEWSRLAAAALPPRLSSRSFVSHSLDHASSETEIGTAAKEAASALRAQESLAITDRLLERAGSAGRGAAGAPAVRRALEARAVDELLLSPGFMSAFADEAEELVHAAYAQGAEVEVLSSEAAAHIDRAGGGIAARLRFPLESIPGLDLVGEGSALAATRPTA